MLTFLKLGGSLITDKQVEKKFRQDVVKRLADEIVSAWAEQPGSKLLIGHGSGSFGHFAAKRRNTINGVFSKEDWQAFAQVSNVAAELNYLVCDALQRAGLPVWRMQPSASLMADNGDVTSMAIHTLQAAFTNSLVPVIYGDVAIDSSLGGTIISTEKLFFYLVTKFPVDRVFLLGEVPGVYDANSHIVTSITALSYPTLAAALGGSGGTDVTGGMETKVEDMLEVIRISPEVKIRIFSGLQEKVLYNALVDKLHPGTLISS